MKLIATHNFAKEIRRLTGIDAESNTEHPIATRLARVEECYDQGNENRLRLEYLKVKMLLQALGCIEGIGGNRLARIAKRLRGCNENTYYGAVQEIMTGGRLSKNGVAFEVDECPDFTVQLEGVDLGIECTSAHFAPERTSEWLDHIQQKIRGAISKKAKPDYVRKLRIPPMRTALFVDITGVHSRSTDDANLLGERNALSEYLASVPDVEVYGAVACFTFDCEPQSYDYLYNVAGLHTHEYTGPALKRLLDEAFGGPELKLEGALVPNDP